MTTQTASSPIVTVRALARYLQVHPSTIYRLAKRGSLPAFKIGSDWRFNREDIDRWRLTRTVGIPLAPNETAAGHQE